MAIYSYSVCWDLAEDTLKAQINYVRWRSFVPACSSEKWTDISMQNNDTVQHNLHHCSSQGEAVTTPGTDGNAALIPQISRAFWTYSLLLLSLLVLCANGWGKELQIKLCY